MRLSIFENIMLPSWMKYGFPLDMGKARKTAKKTSKSLKIIMADLNMPVSSLSGGNAQKVVLGKWLQRKPRILLLNDPTKGVDVGTKKEFYDLLNELCQAGTSILFYSSDDEELVGLCDRVLVMRDGKIRKELPKSELTLSSLITASVTSSEEGLATRLTALTSNSVRDWVSATARWSDRSALSLSASSKTPPET